MKRLVRESIDFERGEGAKRTLRIGVHPDNPKLLVPYVVDKLPEILGKEHLKIEDLLDDWEGLDYKSGDKIHQWLKREFRRDFLNRIEQDLPLVDYNIWELIPKEIKKRRRRRRVLKESLSFTRGENPKRTLDLGIAPDDRESFVPFIVNTIPQILGKSQIPEDILWRSKIEKGLGYRFNLKYIHTIWIWIVKNFFYHEGRIVLSYNLWDYLADDLERRGFSPKILESISFERGRDPKRTLGLGPNPDDKESFVPYVVGKLPEILGRKTIPKDILGIAEGPYIRSDYSDKIALWLEENFRRDFDYDTGGDLGSGDLEPIEWSIWKGLHDRLREMGFRYVDQ